MSAIDTEDNPGRIVFVISWLLFCIIWLTVCTRLATRWNIGGKLEGDDYLTVVALAFSSGQTGAITVAISNGLGQQINTLSALQISKFQESLYASNLLFILTLFFAKGAVLRLLIQLTPSSSHRKLCLWVGVFIGFWALTSIFAAAFQCGLPEAWKFIDHHCFNLTAFWNYFGILNIATDCVLIALPPFILWQVRIESNRKAAITACFASRITVIVAAILQLVYAQKTYMSKDLTSKIWKEALCGQVVQNLSVITCCVPYLKPFYLGLESGLIRTDDLRRHGHVGAYGYGTHKSEQGTAKNHPFTPIGIKDRYNISKEEGSFKVAPIKLQNLTTVTGDMKPADWDARSQETVNSNAHIIKQTTEWTVDREG